MRKIVKKKIRIYGVEEIKQLPNPEQLKEVLDSIFRSLDRDGYTEYMKFSIDYGLELILPLLEVLLHIRLDIENGPDSFGYVCPLTRLNTYNNTILIGINEWLKLKKHRRLIMSLLEPFF